MGNSLSQIHKAIHADTLSAARNLRSDGDVHARLLALAASSRFYFKSFRSVEVAEANAANPNSGKVKAAWLALRAEFKQTEQQLEASEALDEELAQRYESQFKELDQLERQMMAAGISF